MSEKLYYYLCMSMSKEHSLPTGYSLYVYVGKAPATKEDMQVVKDVMDGSRAMRTKNKPRWIL
jgi:hypothetical protein